MKKKIEACIGTDRNGGMRARLSLLLMDGDSVVFEHYHSVAFRPGEDDLDAIKAAVDVHLQSAESGIPGGPWPKIPDDVWAAVKAHAAIEA